MTEAKSAALVTLIAFLVSATLLYLMISILISGSGMVFGMFSTIVAWLDSLAPNSLLPGAAMGNALDMIVTFLKGFLLPLLVNIPAMVFLRSSSSPVSFFFSSKGPLLPGRYMNPCRED